MYGNSACTTPSGHSTFHTVRAQSGGEERKRGTGAASRVGEPDAVTMGSLDEAGNCSGRVAIGNV
jgi:hypothetical protein